MGWRTHGPLADSLDAQYYVDTSLNFVVVVSAGQDRLKWKSLRVEVGRASIPTNWGNTDVVAAKDTLVILASEKDRLELPISPAFSGIADSWYYSHANLNILNELLSTLPKDERDRIVSFLRSASPAWLATTVNGKPLTHNTAP